MKPRRKPRWRRPWGILLLACVSLGGLSRSAPGRHVLASAHSFVSYYRALENSGVPTSFWERVVFSLALASADSPGA